MVSALKVIELLNAVEFEIIARPKARWNAFMGVHDGALKVSITQPAEKSKANKAIIKFLAKKFGVPQSSICIISGETARRKRIRIDGLTASQLKSLI